MNNWQLIITLGVFVAAIFGATWLNHQLLKSYIDAKFDGLQQTIEARFATIDARFAALDARFAAIDQRFLAIENRLDRIERQLESIFKPSLPGR